MLSISRCNNVNDLRSLAKRRLPRSMFHYIDGGADDEVTLRRNTDAFEDYEIQPRFLRPVDEIDTTVTLFGKKLDIPFFIAPTGMSRLFHHTKENAVARAAAKFGTAYSLSTLGTASLEEISEETDGPKMFQIYILKDRELTREFVERCKAANYDALCLTVDVPLAGNRERDKVTGMTMPPRFTMKSFFSFFTHPNWSFNFLLHPDFRLANVVHRVDALGKGAMGLIEYVNSQFDRTVTWDDASRLIQQWGGPFVIKGVLTSEDAKRAREIGATALMISNHGGRQVDGAVASLDVLPGIAEAVGEQLTVLFDSGVRSGPDVLKALALGADAVLLGRPYLYGLALGGQEGVEHVLRCLLAELDLTMGNAGCSTLADLVPDLLTRSPR